MYLETRGDSLVKPCHFPPAARKSPLLLGRKGRANMKSSCGMLDGWARQVFTTWLLKSSLPRAKYSHSDFIFES